MKKNQKIKFYYTKDSDCCQKALKFLKDNNIEFELIDVSKKENILEMFEKSSKQYVPQFEIKNKIIVGFNHKVLKAALGL